LVNEDINNIVEEKIVKDIDIYNIYIKELYDIDVNILNYKIYNDYIIFKDLKGIIKECKENNLGKEKYYKYIDNSPDGKIIDHHLKLYDYNCERIWNNIIKKNVLNKEGVFKIIYYDYIIGCLDGCEDCDSEEYGECKYKIIIYNYFETKLEKKRHKPP
jgi:hypothetical protein